MNTSACQLFANLGREISLTSYIDRERAFLFCREFRHWCNATMLSCYMTPCKPRTARTDDLYPFVYYISTRVKIITIIIILTARFNSALQCGFCFRPYKTRGWTVAVVAFFSLILSSFISIGICTTEGNKNKYSHKWKELIPGIKEGSALSSVNCVRW